MGLNDLLVDDESESTEDQGKGDERDPSDTREAIESNIKEKSMLKIDGITVDGDTLTGEIKDFAMLFALIGMDYSEVDLDNLAGKEE